MEKKLGWGVLGLAVFGLMACSGPRPGSASTAPAAGVSAPSAPTGGGQSQALVQRTNIKLVAGIRDGGTLSLDPANTDYLGSGRTVVSDRAMSFPQSILLPTLSPDPNGGLTDLFFMIPAGSLDAPIRQVTYQLLLEDTNQTTEVGITEAAYDSGSSSFYIPLTSLFGAGWTAAAQGDRHILVLELALNDDRSYEIRTDFSVTGFPVTPSYNAVSPAIPSTPVGFASTLVQGTILSETFSNPKSHAVTLWVRNDPKTSIQFETRISHSSWSAQAPNLNDAGHSGCAPSPGHLDEECFPLSNPSSTYASADLAITGVRVSGAEQMTLGDPTQWTAIPLASNSSVTIAWVASPNGGTPNCTFAPHVMQNITWQEAIHNCFDHSPQPNPPCTAANAISNGYKPHQNDFFPIDTAIEGTSVSGQLWRDVLVAEPFVTAAQIAGRDKLPPELQARVIAVASGSRTVFGQAGAAPIEDDASPDACQGVF